MNSKTGSLAQETLSNRVKALAQEAFPKVMEWRRDFHQYPELSNREQRTSGKVAEALKAMGVDDLRTGVAHHGVVALIKGNHAGPTVGLRADMDALPIPEATGLPFSSKNPGVMHACGHDSHTAMLLGTGSLLTRLRGEIHGAVKLIFQPAEEQPPVGEDGGARMMVEQGALTSPDVSAVFALHVCPQVRTGQVSYMPGNSMAAAERFQIVIRGKGSHAAMPWMGVDPVYVSARVVDALQSIRSRETRDLLVVTVGSIHGGQRWNIIPDTVTLEGTIRTFDPEVRKRVLESFNRIVHATAEAHGASAAITLEHLVPVNRNDPTLAQSARASLAAIVGEGNILQGEPSTGMDDFAFFAQKSPGLYVDLGVRNEALGVVHPIHNERFMLDEAALPLGVGALAMMALDYLREHGERL